MKSSMKIQYSLVLSVSVLLGAGCGKQAPPPMMVTPVKVQVIESQRLEEKTEFVGSVVANEIVEIQSEAEGTVRQIHFNEGQSVQRGALLIELDSEKLSSSVSESEALFQLTQSNIERSKSLLASRSISQQEFDQAKSNFEGAQASLALAKKRLEEARIVASFDGILGPRKVSPGQVITRGTVLTSLVSINPAKVEFSIPERYLNRVRAEQSFELRVDAFPNEVFRGKVYFVSPSVDEKTRTAFIKGSLDNSDLRLHPGMLGRIDLILGVKEDALLVSETALIPRGSDVSVFIVDAQDTAQPKMVKIGLRLKGQVEVIEGLQKGDRVVIEGLQKLRPGAKVMTGDSGSKTSTSREPNEKKGSH
jgi:membrane fusion protein, multidrug efflux system